MNRQTFYQGTWYVHTITDDDDMAVCTRSLTFSDELLLLPLKS